MKTGRAWTICDRCGLTYRRNQVVRESTGLLVCRSCNDGAYDAKRHPQNRAARIGAEPRIVPDGRPDVDITNYLLTENSNIIATELGDSMVVNDLVWSPSLSTYVGAA